MKAESDEGPRRARLQPKFARAVYAVVRHVPRGTVVTYGQVAAILGHPRAARAVGTALARLPHSLAHKVPWQRVINAAGKISYKGDFFRPVPLLPEDVLQYEVSVPGLVAALRRENGIDGTGGEESDGLVPLGQKAVEGFGRVPVHLSFPNDGEARPLLVLCPRP